MTDFSLEDLLGAFQTCEHPFRAICLLATHLGQKSDRNELHDISNVINSWMPIEKRVKQGRVKNALTSLEASFMVTCEQDRFVKAQRRFYQISNLGRATLLFLMCSSGFLTTLRAETLQHSWEKVDTGPVLNEALSFTLEKLRPYRELSQALNNRSAALPTTAKKYFLTWTPEKVLGVKGSERIKLFECLIWEQTSLGVGLLSKEIDAMFPDLSRASNMAKKLDHLIDINVLQGDGLLIYRLSSIGLQCLFPLGLMIAESDAYRKILDPRPLLLPPTEEIEMRRHLVSNALDFFKGLSAGLPTETG